MTIYKIILRGIVYKTKSKKECDETVSNLIELGFLPVVSFEFQA